MNMLNGMPLDQLLIIGRDGNQFFCAKGDFINPQESNMGWGSTPEIALHEFTQSEKLWRTRDEFLAYMGIEDEVLNQRIGDGQRAIELITDLGLNLEKSSSFVSINHPKLIGWHSYKSKALHENAMDALADALNMFNTYTLMMNSRQGQARREAKQLLESWGYQLEKGEHSNVSAKEE